MVAHRTHPNRAIHGLTTTYPVFFSFVAQHARQKEEHLSEVASLEKGLRDAENRCRETRRSNDALRDSRERVADTVATASRRRGGVAAAAEERGGRALQWCFWGWSRLARQGDAAMERRAARVETEQKLPGVGEMLQAAKEKARGAEAERDRHR